MFSTLGEIAPLHELWHATAPYEGRLLVDESHSFGGLRRLGLTIDDSIAPVASFKTGSKEAMLSLKRALSSEGIFVYHSTYIGSGSEGVIRCGIFADHTREHIEALIGALRKLM